ncbi:MAG: hypothetical protein IID05_04195, partial [Gemmatimonadetes bacterium]|nr:hypothetical protein [Gemmatimonadota bacterium]
MRRSIAFVTVASLLIIAACEQSLDPVGVDPNVVGPNLGTATSNGTAAQLFVHVFVRRLGGPQTETATIPDLTGSFVLRVRNGDESGANRVSSATVALNGVQLFGSSDFNQQVFDLLVEVDLDDPSELEVLLAGAPGGTLEVSVFDGGVPVGPAGGSIELRDGTVGLDIPAGAITEDQGDLILTVDPIDPGSGEVPEETGPLPGTVFNFGPDGTQFAEPIEITVSYDPD